MGKKRLHTPAANSFCQRQDHLLRHSLQQVWRSLRLELSDSERFRNLCRIWPILGKINKTKLHNSVREPVLQEIIPINSWRKSCQNYSRNCELPPSISTRLLQNLNLPEKVKTIWSSPGSHRSQSDPTMGVETVLHPAISTNSTVHHTQGCLSPSETNLIHKYE